MNNNNRNIEVTKRNDNQKVVIPVNFIRYIKSTNNGTLVHYMYKSSDEYIEDSIHVNEDVDTIFNMCSYFEDPDMDKRYKHDNSGDSIYVYFYAVNYGKIALPYHSIETYNDCYNDSIGYDTNIILSTGWWIEVEETYRSISMTDTEIQEQEN